MNNNKNALESIVEGITEDIPPINEDSLVNNINAIQPKKSIYYDPIKEKKFEFSKIIFIIVLTMVVIVLVFSFAIMWRTGDSTPLIYLIPSVFTAFATCIGFYFDKSKKENMIKNRCFYGSDVMNDIKDDIN